MKHFVGYILDFLKFLDTVIYCLKKHVFLVNNRNLTLIMQSLFFLMHIISVMFDLKIYSLSRI